MSGGRRDPFSRSYGVRLPSSLTAVLSSALGYSPHLPVSVLVRATVSSPLHFSRPFLHRLRQQNGLDLAKPPRLIGGSALKGHMQRFNLPEAFLGDTSRDFGVVNVLALAGPASSSRLAFPYRVTRVVPRTGAGILTRRPSSTPFGLD